MSGGKDINDPTQQGVGSGQTNYLMPSGAKIGFSEISASWNRNNTENTRTVLKQG
jgi:hypothetical protein